MSFTCPVKALCGVSQCTPAYTNAVVHSSTYEYCSFIFWGNTTSKCRFGVVAILTLTAEIVCTVTFTSKHVFHIWQTQKHSKSLLQTVFIFTALQESSNHSPCLPICIVYIWIQPMFAVIVCASAGIWTMWGIHNGNGRNGSLLVQHVLSAQMSLSISLCSLNDTWA